MALRQPKVFWGLVACYFASQLMLRAFTLASLEWDQSEQAFLTQWWAWGYGIQPPLFNWLQKAFVDAFVWSGLPLLSALLFLKVLVVAGTHAWVYGTVRLVSHSHVRAAIAVLTMFLFPQYFWESVRDLSHTVLATHLCIASVYFAVAIVLKRRLWSYAGLGVAIGLAVMAKYNVVLFFAAMFVSALFVKPARAALLHTYLLVTFVIVALVSSFHSLWLLPRLMDTLGATTVKVGAEGAVAFYEPLLAVISGLLGFFVVFLLIGIPLLWRKLSFAEVKREFIEQPVQRWLILQLLAMFVLLVISAYATGMTEMKDRYLQTFFITWPVLIGLFVSKVELAGALRRLGRYAAVIWVLSFIGTIAVVYFGDEIGENARFNKPYAQFSVELSKQTDLDLIVTENFRVAGNLVAQLPESLVLSLGFDAIEPNVQSYQNAILVWEKGEGLPSVLAKWGSSKGFQQCDEGEIKAFTSLYHHSKQAAATWYYCEVSR